VAGAVTTVLLAPESGEKTRARIRKGASNVVGQAKGKIVEGLEILEGALEDK
jgi:gas vesicle protein